jgi:hypothetical protein
MSFPLDVLVHLDTTLFLFHVLFVCLFVLIEDFINSRADDLYIQVG